MQNYYVEGIKAEFSDLNSLEKIELLRWLFKTEPHKYEYAMLDSGTRKFYGIDGKRI